MNIDHFSKHTKILDLTSASTKLTECKIRFSYLIDGNQITILIVYCLSSDLETL